jgi:hypothetical protein
MWKVSFENKHSEMAWQAQRANYSGTICGPKKISGGARLPGSWQSISRMKGQKPSNYRVIYIFLSKAFRPKLLARSRRSSADNGPEDYEEASDGFPTNIYAPHQVTSSADGQGYKAPTRWCFRPPRGGTYNTVWGDIKNYYCGGRLCPKPRSVKSCCIPAGMLGRGPVHIAKSGAGRLGWSQAFVKETRSKYQVGGLLRALELRNGKLDKSRFYRIR